MSWIVRPLHPLDSHLLLKKDNDIDRLSIIALLEAKSGERSWTAYLSVCSTAEVRTKALVDESPLELCLQMIGFALVDPFLSYV